MELKTFIFIGRSGSGKGTQAKLIADFLKESDSLHNVLYIRTGNLGREFVKKEGLTAQLMKKLLEKGGLFPAFLPIKLWSDELVNKFSGKEHLVFDGTPRKLNEAEILEGAIKFYSMPGIYAVHLNVSREESKNRLLKRGRGDDNEEDINERLNWFETDVLPIIDYFNKSEGIKLLDIDGERSVQEIHEDIKQRVFG